jgi:Arylsulfotransferase (ASST)
MFVWLWACASGRLADSGPIGDLVLSRTLRVRGAEATIECTSPDDGGERHVLTGAGKVALFGLLADTTYRCAADGEPDALEFRTDPLPGWLPSWETEGTADGYTLFNHGLPPSLDTREPKLLIVDPEGRLRWYLADGSNATDLDAQYLGDGRVLYGGGFLADPRVVDLAGDELAEAATDAVYHHHVEQAADGTVWTLRVAENEGGGASWSGFAIEQLDEDLRETLWTWDSQRGVDEGWLPNGLSADPYHANALQITDDAVYVNLRHLGWLVKLDRATGARQWTMGIGQDFSLLAGDWFGKSHAPELLGDELLIYDNRPSDPPSRVARYTFDEAALTATEAWSWTEPGWDEPIWGDVDRLPSGRVLVTKAHDDASSGSPDARTELVEVDPADGAVVWRLTMAAPEDGGYRAARIDPCGLFSNAGYCR